MRRLTVAAALVALASLAAATALAAPPHAKVLVHSTSIGSALVDARGHALYLYLRDGSKKSACYGSCATAWPPFLTSGTPRVGPGAKQSLLGTTKRKDGKLQVTYAGHPLYFFAKDAKAGDVAGQGAGSSWYAVAGSGKRLTAGPPMTTNPPPPPGGGYGGGYDSP